MLHVNEDELPFGEIAGEWAKELANTTGARTRDEILHELFKAIWRGNFEDEDGQNGCLRRYGPPPGGAELMDGMFVDKHGVLTTEKELVTFSRRTLLYLMSCSYSVGRLPLPPVSKLRDWRRPESDDPEPVPWSELKQEIG